MQKHHLSGCVLEIHVSVLIATCLFTLLSLGHMSLPFLSFSLPCLIRIRIALSALVRLIDQTSGWSFTRPSHNCRSCLCFEASSIFSSHYIACLCTLPSNAYTGVACSCIVLVSSRGSLRISRFSLHSLQGEPSAGCPRHHLPLLVHL
jgi:hypothetical protein